MRQHVVLAAAAGVLLSSILIRAQAPQPPTPAPAGTPGGAAAQAPQAPGGRGRGQGQGFPAQQRKLADAAVIERGGTLYGINCRLCHGADLRGGDMGGVNLLRSPIVLGDQDGELIYPVVHNGKQTEGLPPMPPLPLPEADVKAVAAYVHSVAARMAGQGGPPPGEAKELNILVGDAAAGQRYFDANCASCHAAAGDMAGVATRYPTPVALQSAWVAGGGGGRGGRGAAPAGRTPKPVTAVVTTRDGQRVEGRLDRIDDFLVTVTLADGTQKTFARSGNSPTIAITDPLDGHRQLWRKLTDKDIHDVTAYLVTLK
ncbi:MAG TPA: c-type cytochrome [Vicinamibacterales bacterium]|jgi:cytochrome c oxidase cbb3-type subunit 3